MSKEAKQENVQAIAKDDAPVYSAAELAKASEKIFHVSPDITTAALHVAGIKSVTIAQAEKIIKDFANKEVK